MVRELRGELPIIRKRYKIFKTSLACGVQLEIQQNKSSTTTWERVNRQKNNKIHKVKQFAYTLLAHFHVCTEKSSPCWNSMKLLVLG